MRMWSWTWARARRTVRSPDGEGRSVHVWGRATHNAILVAVFATLRRQVVPAPRRRTRGVEVGAGTVQGDAELGNVFAAVLTPLRADSRRVIADLLPCRPLPIDIDA